MTTRALLAGAGFAALLGANAAQAAPCPIGQYYRPSRHICVGKSEFMQAVYHRSGAAQVRAARREAVPVPPRAPRRVADEAPSPSPPRAAQTLAKSPFGNIPGVDTN